MHAINFALTFLEAAITALADAAESAASKAKKGNDEIEDFRKQLRDKVPEQR